ncbi:MAG: glycoside hydrolase family 5 protein, partial [Pseudobdellovibrionaceae bacterium]|nr:glycoside hydrolase family 5 protein [Pseudobdellovibrionaceae bacterium]
MKFCLFLPMILLLNLQLGCAPRDKSRRSTLIPTPNPSEDGSHPWTQGNPVQPEPSPLPIPKPSLPINGFEAIAAMGSGFNLGNIFDRKDKPTTVDEMKAIIDLYYQAGHRHVRLPVTWMDDFEGDHLADANGQLRTNHPRLRDLTTVIDYALAKPMFVIINTHHERWLKRDYKAGTSDVIFANLWHQIAQHFAGYPYELIFEVLNEPEGVFGDFTGTVSPFDAEPMRLTRHINEVGYQAIRNSDPRNQQRLVLILPNAQGNQTLLDEVYPNKGELPDDGN